MNRVTILIPTYNRAQLLSETLDNCLLQTYKDFDIIVYDDASTDKTQDVVKQFQNKFPSLKYIKGSVNKGIGFARHFLLNALENEFGVWLDSDDLMRNDRLQKCINYMDSNKNVDIVYSYIKRFTKNNGNVVLSGELNVDTSRYSKKDYSSLKNNTTCATAFFRSSLKKYEIVDSLRYGSEDVLWLWNLLNNNIKVGQINEPLYYYRSHTGSLTLIKKIKIEEKGKEDIILSKKIKEYGQQ